MMPICSISMAAITVDEVSTNLTSLEVEDLVTLRDVVTLLQRAELVARISDEIERYLVELGTDGRQLRLQLVSPRP